MNEVENAIRKVGKGIAGVQSQNGIYGFVFENGDCFNDTGACHAGVLMKVFCQKKTESPLRYVVTRIGRQKGEMYYKEQASEEATIRWYTYLIEQSVYSRYMVTRDANQAINQKYCVIDASAPGNILQSFCIATRNPWEYPKKIEMFYRLTQLGVQPDYAFLVAYHCHIDSEDGSKGFVVKPNSSHQVFSMSVSIDGAKAWVNHELLCPTPAYFDMTHSRVVNVNLLWTIGEGDFGGSFNEFVQNLDKVEGKCSNPFAKSKSSKTSEKLNFNIESLAKALVEAPSDIFKGV